MNLGNWKMEIGIWMEVFTGLRVSDQICKSYYMFVV